MTAQREFYGWKLVFILWLLDFLNMGFPLYGGAVINTYMLKEIPMSRSAFGLGFTVLNIFVGIPSILVGASIVRWGIRKTFGIGSALILAGALWLSLITSRPWHYWVGFGILAAMGISFGTIIPAATAVTRWFSRYRGRTMAVTLSASGFAGFFVAPTINRILTGNGGNWRQAWAIVAAVSVLSAIVAFLFVRERPEDLGQMVDGGPDAAPSADSTSASARVTKFPWEPHQAYRTRAYWMILIGAIACQFPFFFFTAHWLLHLKGAGVRPADAAFAMGLFTLGAVFGRLIGGWLMDAMEGRYAFMLGFCCYFLGSFLAIRVSPEALWIAYTAAILYGTGFGWTFICFNTVTGHYYGPVAFPKVSGMMLLVAAFFCSPAGYLGGKLFDLLQSYKIAFEINSALAAIGIGALFFARMPEPPRVGILAHETGQLK
ncbi:MAG: MFS transporter [Acidobacteria bacterium 13_2_20CM_57_17]|nr:MAG: MFS transporter [Acidobacteria bacterium 13_2_20CM_57_17]